MSQNQKKVGIGCLGATGLVVLIGLAIWFGTQIVGLLQPTIAQVQPTPDPIGTAVAATLEAMKPVVQQPPVQQPPVQPPVVQPVVNNQAPQQVWSVQWGPGGPAPQTAEEASRVLGVPVTALTVLYPKPGDATAIGWVIGDPSYQTVYTAKAPSGTCVDYIRSSGKLNGNTVWHVAYQSADWNRALMGSDGSTTGVKATIYWTPCEKGNGTEVTSGTTQYNAPAPKAVGCPTNSGDAANMIGGNAANWSEKPNTNHTGWYYSGPEIEFRVPGVGRLDHASGTLRAGQNAPYPLPRGVVATLWCNG